MSHVATVELLVQDLDALSKACKALGVELVRNQTTYRRYFGSVTGECLHAIRVPGVANAYEIGITQRADGKAGYSLLWDNYAGGHGLVAKVGESANKLKQAYAAEVAVKHYQKNGYRVQKSVKEDGQVVLTATK